MPLRIIGGVLVAMRKCSWASVKSPASTSALARIIRISAKPGTNSKDLRACKIAGSRFLLAGVDALSCWEAKVPRSSFWYFNKNHDAMLPCATQLFSVTEIAWVKRVL